MGRRPTKNKNLPSGMRKRKKASGKIYYYYDTGGKPRHEKPLGCDYALAVKQWSELEMEGKQRHVAIITFRYVAERYLREVVPTKAPRTQKDNLLQLKFLYHFFDNPPAPLEKIKPIDISCYLDRRSKPFQIDDVHHKGSKTQANREKALFSHIWNMAREWGYTDKPNPCSGIKGHKEKARDIYVADTDFAVAYNKVSQPVKDFLDLLYLTGARPADVLKLTRHNIKDGVLTIKPGKTENSTGKIIRMEVIGELKAVLDRMAARGVTSLRLVVAENGQALTLSGIRARFKREAGADFQLRDLRAKAGTDVAEETGDARKAQKQLGHSTITMTETYLRSRGEKVKPTK